MDKHWKWPVISFIVGTGLAIGALGVQEMQNKPAWMVPALFSASAVLLVIAIVWASWEVVPLGAALLRQFEWQWPLRRRGSVTATSEEHSELLSLRSRVQALEPFKKQADAEREMWADEKKDLKEQLEASDRGFVAASAEAREHHQIRAFGRTLRELPALDVTTQEAVRVQLAQIAPLLSAMYNEANAMWQRVGADAQVAGQGTAISWLHGYVHENEYFWIRNTAERFWEALDGKRDLRGLLTTICLNYFAWRDKIVLLGALSGQPVLKRDGYAKWQQSEMAFFADLQKKVAIPEVDDVRHQIRAHFNRQGSIVKPEMPPEQLALPAFFTALVQAKLEEPAVMRSESNIVAPPSRSIES